MTLSVMDFRQWGEHPVPLYRTSVSDGISVFAFSDTSVLALDTGTGLVVFDLGIRDYCSDLL